MLSPSDGLSIGGRVRVQSTWLDEERKRPLVGTVRDMFPRSDWHGDTAFVVVFDEPEPWQPWGGEFSAGALEPWTG